MNTSAPTPLPIALTVAAPNKVTEDELGLIELPKDPFRSEVDPVIRGMGFEIIECEILFGDGGGFAECLRS